MSATGRSAKSMPPHRWGSSQALRSIAALMIVVAAVGSAVGHPSNVEALTLGSGNYSVMASVFGTDLDGLIGKETSNGRKIRPFDRLVALPACTESSCPWLSIFADPDGKWGPQTACAEADGLCWVQITSVDTGKCAVAPVLDRGPLFTKDNWWDARQNRRYDLEHGLPAAEAARDGADLGFGKGKSDAGYDVANDYPYAAAVDIGAGMWVYLGLDPDQGIGEVKIRLLWQAGASHLNACGANYGNGQTIDSVNLRAGPSTDDDIQTVLPANYRLSITGATQNGFYLVDVDGRRGWVFNEWARPDGGKAKSKVGFITDEVNFRAGPSTSDQIYREVPEGSIVVISGKEENGFLPVKYLKKAGWISSDYIDLGDAGNGGGGGSGDGETAITTDDVNFRAGSSLSVGIISVLAPGSEVKITGDEVNGFMPVTYGGYDGWVYSAYLLIESGGDDTMKVTENLNLRDGPSTSDKILEVMPAGATVTITGEAENGFLQVSYKGTDGWAFAQYLE